MADYTRKPSTGSTTSPGPRAPEPSPGKHTLVEALPVAVQRRSPPTGDASDDVGASSSHTGTAAPAGDAGQRRGGPTPQQVHAAAARGIAGGATPLPFADRIQASFGRHDITSIQAHVGGAAAQAAAAMGATAYATGNHVAFGSAPDVHTAAHEAAHVVQQRAGVHLQGGVGKTGDAHEQHADAVADKVVRGESAERLLDAYAGSGPRSGHAATAAGAAAGENTAAHPAPAPEDPVQLITRTVGTNPPVAIDIATLDDDGCREHLARIGRINAGHPTGNDAEFHYDAGDRDAIRARQAQLLEGRRTTLVNALVAQLAGLGTAADHQVQPPWNGHNPAGVEGPEVAGANVQPVEATIVAAWTAFLGAGPYSHKHPRTGAVDPTRLVSADGQRSIRYGNHERNSSAANHHFHQETWVHDAGANTVTVNNTMRRASVR